MPLSFRFRSLALTVVVGMTLASSLLSSDAHAVTKDDIINLTKVNLSDEDIIKLIDRDRTVFNLGMADILELKKANVSQVVIEYMLKSPATFGGPAEPATTVPTEPTETEEERTAREERMKAEAAKLLAEKQAAEELQRKAFAQGVLAKCRSLGDEGDYVGAIRAAQQFIAQGNFAPDSEESYFARFCIANALVKADLLQSAASELVDVVLDGPDRPFFQTAFQQLRTLRKKIDYSPPQLERLSDVAGNISGFSQPFQDEFNYVLGEFFHEGTEWTTAIAFLEAVTPQAKDYGKAQYLKGYMEVQNDLYKSAVQSFQKAIIATEENESDPEVRDLAFLALARIAYKVGDYDAAIYYYRKVPQGSYKQATAFYESAWVYFLKGDYARALGTMHTLDSPYFKHYFYPEMWILEATAYLNTCHFDRTKLSLMRFEKDVLPLITPLENFLKVTTKPAEFYKAVIATVGGKSVYELPDKLIASVLANVEFYNLYRTIKQIEGEIRRLNEDGAALGTYGSELLAQLKKLRQDRIRQIGLTIRLILSDVQKELKKFRIKYTEVGIDLEDIRIEEEDRRQAALDGEIGPDAEARAEAGGSTAIVGSDRWKWAFQREYWSDEIGTYRSYIKDTCAKEQL